jgi:hypothetical protein
MLIGRAVLPLFFTSRINFVGLFNVREKKKKENEKQSFAKDNDETISNIFLLLN